jgi:hypothetical protein
MVLGPRRGAPPSRLHHDGGQNSAAAPARSDRGATESRVLAWDAIYLVGLLLEYRRAAQYTGRRSYHEPILFVSRTDTWRLLSMTTSTDFGPAPCWLRLQQITEYATDAKIPGLAQNVVRNIWTRRANGRCAQ